MTITDWLGVILTTLSILTIVGLVTRWILRHYLEDVIKELRPNGGSSIKDQVNGLEKSLASLKKESIQTRENEKDLNEKITNLTNLFIEYLSRQK